MGFLPLKGFCNRTVSHKGRIVSMFKLGSQETGPIGQETGAWLCDVGQVLASTASTVQQGAENSVS